MLQEGEESRPVGLPGSGQDEPGIPQPADRAVHDAGTQPKSLGENGIRVAVMPGERQGNINRSERFGASLIHLPYSPFENTE
jgi:hypothetical protein